MGYEIPPDHHSSNSMIREQDKVLHSSNCACRYCDEDRKIKTEAKPQQQTTHSQVIHKLSEVQRLLKEVHTLAIQANPLCAAIPVFLEIETLGKKMSGLMQDVNKLKGL